MNSHRPNRRYHAYRAAQKPIELSEAEIQEFTGEDSIYYEKNGASGQLKARCPDFKELGIDPTENYKHDKREACKALEDARFNPEPIFKLWPRNKDGNRMGWLDAQVEENPSGQARDAAEAKKMHLFYPHQGFDGGLVTSAPFCKGPKNLTWEFRVPDFNKDVTLCQVLAIGEIRQNVLRHLSYPDISALELTCTMLANQVMGTPALWDMSTGKCNYSEFTQDEFAVLKQKGEAGEDAQQGNNEFVIVSQTHLGFNKEQSRQNHPNNLIQIRGLLSVARGLQLTGDSIRRVCFNRVNFFDLGVFATFLDMMPNLERADITSCDLVRYHHVPGLIDMVHAHNEKYGIKVLLDVAPRYHHGPYWENSNTDAARDGTYGLTSRDPGTKIPPAVVKTFIYDVYPRMKKAGQMHMMWSNALFRRFLEKLPLHRLTVPRMEAVAEHKEDLRKRFRRRNFSKVLKARLLIRCAFAELSTIFGDGGWLQLNEDGAVSCDSQGTAANYGVWADQAHCRRCGIRLWLIYFTTGFVCDSCYLIEFIDGETYFWANRKRQGARLLGCGPIDGLMVPLAQTNMDFTIHRPSTDGTTTRITEVNDFDRINELENPKLRRLFNHVRAMDRRHFMGLCIDDMKFQRRHPYDRLPDPKDTQVDNLHLAKYRKPLTLEEIRKAPNGRAPSNAAMW
ncbi:hypothetical protein diail_5654 [Diaporthe ilicicola]|nr:hypothetical protein diail_5654 [Diaporthe ilicicola]